MGSKLILATIFCLIVADLNVSGSKICYVCDQQKPSPWWKFWGQKITRCNGIAFEKYATKTSKAFRGGDLTCYTTFDETDAVIKRDAYGPRDAWNRTLCVGRFNICCKKDLCNKDNEPPCPPPHTLNAEITFEDVRKTKYSLDTIVECDNQCTESSDCATIPIGAKPCGGPSGYLIYSKSSVYSNYIQKLALFITELEKIYNEQHAIISNCMVTPMRGASCHRNRCI